MKTIEEFLTERIREIETNFQGLNIPYERQWDVRVMISNMRDVLTFHKDWPVWIQSEPIFETQATPENFVYRVTQKIDWMTQEAYRKQFGSEPPTTPMLKKMLKLWSNHTDFNPDWLL